MSLEGIGDDNGLCYCIRYLTLPNPDILSLAAARCSSGTARGGIGVDHLGPLTRPLLLRFVPPVFDRCLLFVFRVSLPWSHPYLSQLRTLSLLGKRLLISLTPGLLSETTMTLPLAIMTVMTAISGIEQDPGVCICFFQGLLPSFPSSFDVTGLPLNRCDLETLLDTLLDLAWGIVAGGHESRLSMFCLSRGSGALLTR